MDNTDLTFEGSTATWTMPQMQGDIGGTYNGVFKFHTYLSPIQSLAAAKKHRELMGENAGLASNHDSYLCYALTQLEKRVISAPPFWLTPIQNQEMAGSIPDENIILAVLDAAVRAQSIYKERLIEQRKSVLTRTITIAEEMLKADQGEE